MPNPVAEVVERLRTEFFALCESIEEQYGPIGQRDLEGKEGAFARGRTFEAKSIRREMGERFRVAIGELKSQAERLSRERDTGVPEGWQDDVPAGAIDNGRELLRRLVDNYDFQSEGGPLRNCSEFQDAIRCFEAMAEWISANATLTRERDQAREALAPFAAAATTYDQPFLYEGRWQILPDDTAVSDLDTKIKIGELRRARSVLRPEKPEVTHDT